MSPLQMLGFKSTIAESALVSQSLKESLESLIIKALHRRQKLSKKGFYVPKGGIFKLTRLKLEKIEIKAASTFAEIFTPVMV